MIALFAFLHHIAAFALAAILTVQMVLLKGELSLQSARKIRLYDLALGIAAGSIFVVGWLRVLYFEKGADYYLHNAAFIIKLSLFVAVALLSIYPTREFLSWKKPLQEGRMPAVSERKLRSLRAVIHVELTGVVLVILCAVLMARGVG